MTARDGQGAAPATPEDPTAHLWSLASDHVALKSSVWARRPAAPSLGIANFLYRVRPDDVRALDADLAAVAGAGGRARVVIERDTPDWVEAELTIRRWEAEREFRLWLAPGRSLTGSPPPWDVRPAAEADPDWSVRRAMFRQDHLEEDTRRGEPPRPAEETGAVIDHRRDLERHATYHCVLDGGVLAGFVCAWPGRGDGAVIEDLYVRPECRGRGVASALLHDAVGALRRAGAGGITISAEVGDTPAELYARLGFRPLRVARSYVA